MSVYSAMTKLLDEREESGNPINVAIMGIGWVGTGLVREILRTHGIDCPILFSRNVEKAVYALQSEGISKENIKVVETETDLKESFKTSQYVVTSNTDLIDNLPNIDIFYDSTGNILAGAKAALSVINQKIH